MQNISTEVVVGGPPCQGMSSGDVLTAREHQIVRMLRRITSEDVELLGALIESYAEEVVVVPPARRPASHLRLVVGGMQ